MPRKEFVCLSCDNSFTITFKGGDVINHCPFCGEGLYNEESNEFEVEFSDEDE